MRFLVMAFSLFLILGGLVDGWAGLNNPDPAEMTVAEYAASDKSAKWVTLTDAKIDLTKGAVLKTAGKVSRIYVPIESQNFKQEGKVVLLLNSVDDSMLEVARALNGMSSGEQLKYLVENRDKLLISGPVSGRVSSRHGLSGDKEEEIRKLIDNLDEDFYLINHNGYPSLVRGSLMTLFGVGLFFLARRKKKKTA